MSDTTLSIEALERLNFESLISDGMVEVSRDELRSLVGEVLSLRLERRNDEAVIARLSEVVEERSWRSLFGRIMQAASRRGGK